MSTPLDRSHDDRDPARDRGHDLHVVRRTDREEAQRHGWCHGDGQLRDREGKGLVPGHRHARRPHRPSRSDRLQRTSAGEREAAPPPRERRRTTARATTRALRQRLILSGVLALPVVALAMVSALQFDGWQWLSLTLAAPVVVWGAWPFHTAAWTNLRHGAATMDTLISVGTIAAFGWSLYALFIGDAGELGDASRILHHARAGDGCRPDLPGGRRRRDGVHPRRPLLRGRREAAIWRRPEGAARARREGRCSAPRRQRVPHTSRRPRRRRPFRRASWGEGRN